MKELIKKQEEELDDKQLLILKHLVLGNALELYKGGERAQVVIDEMQKFIKKYIVKKIRKETAKAVCDKIEENRKEIKQFDPDRDEYNRGMEAGYNYALDDVEELKKQIIENL